jgi:DNA-nicking Smr family endonuclease
LTDSISKKDKKDWENFLSSNEKLPNKDLKLKQHLSIKTKSIDLHGYTLDEANKVINDFIKNCYNEKVNKIIVVTGKGLHSENEKNPYVSKNLSILKYSIPEYISNNKSLMNIINEIKDAKIEDGGDGAFYILLKKNLKIT